jgi:hypothetical protein
MLFVFNNNNTIQVAWGAKAPSPKAESRAQELDVRSGTVGVVRTGSAG